MCDISRVGRDVRSVLRDVICVGLNIVCIGRDICRVRRNVACILCDISRVDRDVIRVSLNIVCVLCDICRVRRDIVFCCRHSVIEVGQVFADALFEIIYSGVEVGYACLELGHIVLQVGYARFEVIDSCFGFSQADVVPFVICTYYIAARCDIACYIYIACRGVYR